MMVLFLSFVNLIFEFVSSFEIRISNFSMSEQHIMPSGPGFLHPGLTGDDTLILD